MPMYDLSPIEQAGIPITKKLAKYGNIVDQNGKTISRDPLKYNLNYDDLYIIQKEQNRIEILERYMWINVPFGISADIIERILYYRGRGVFYYNEDLEKFQFLPFALHDIVDEYGRFTMCNSLVFTGSDSEKKDKKREIRAVKENIELVYDLPYNKDMLENIRKKKNYGIILNDSSLGLSQQPIIRANYVKSVLHLMATMMQIINTAIFGSADHSLLQVESEADYDALNAQIDAINQDILKGRRFTGLIGTFPITPLKTSSTYDVEGLFATYNSLSNLLKTINGIANSGLFDKKAHLLQEEQNLNETNADDIYYNGLRMRQEFCLMVQAYYGYPVWCSSKRTITEQQAFDMAQGETTDPDNTVQKNGYGGNNNGGNAGV